MFLNAKNIEHGAEMINNSGDRFIPIFNTLNQVILEYKLKNPSMEDVDLLQSLNSIRMFLKKRKIVLNSLDREIFNALAGIANLGRYNTRDAIACLNMLQENVKRAMGAGNSYIMALDTH